MVKHQDTVSPSYLKAMSLSLCLSLWGCLSLSLGLSVSFSGAVCLSLGLSVSLSGAVFVCLWGCLQVINMYGELIMEAASHKVRFPREWGSGAGNPGSVSGLWGSGSASGL